MGMACQILPHMDWFTLELDFDSAFGGWVGEGMS